MGNRSFIGRGSGFTINTEKKITVVTQFITNTGTASGQLSEIRRLYVQDGNVVQNSVANFPGIPSVNSLTDSFCAAQKTVFNDQNQYQALGGMNGMGQAMSGTGMVLAMSIWDDHAYVHSTSVNRIGTYSHSIIL